MDLSRLPNNDYGRDVTAIAMVFRSPGQFSRSYYLIGQTDGCLSVTEASGRGRTAFRSRISDYPIAAVAWEGEDWDDFIFYVGDVKGNLYTVNRKGKIVKETNIPERKGGIHVITTTDKNKIHVYTSKGRQSLSHTTTDFRKENFTTITAGFSVDRDGTFHRQRGGDYDVIQFNAKTSSNVVVCVGMEFGRKVGDYEEVLAYAIVDEEYENLVEDGTADKKFLVLRNGKTVREIVFTSPVKQIMSCRHHEGAEADDIYFLTCNGIVYKVNGTQLADESIVSDNLDMKIIANLDDEDDNYEFSGFCVYRDYICVFGKDGLFTKRI